MSTTTITQTTAGTYTWICPPGVTSLSVELWGSGGGGGSSDSATRAGGGGGGGEYSINPSLAVTSGTTYTYVIPVGGTAAANAAGGTAANTTFGSTLVVAIGGGGGGKGTGSTYGAKGGKGTGGTGTTQYTGGDGLAGTTTYGGGGGASGGTGSNGTNASAQAGADAVSGGGNGGAGGNAHAVGVTPTTPPGGGGGGAGHYDGTTKRAGGVGAVGQARLIYTNPPISALVDNFNDNSIDAAKWSNQGGVQIVEANQELELTSKTSAQDVYIRSQVNYDLTGSGATIKIVDAGNQSLASWVFYFDLNDGANDIYWKIQAGIIMTALSAKTDTYVAATYKYLRTREASGVLYCDYSADGINWTNFNTYSPSSDITLTTIKPVFEIVNSTEASTTTAKVDDFNLINISQLTDNFNDNSIDAAKWDTDSSQVTVAETNSNLEFTTTGTNGYCNFYSVAYYDLTGSQATIKVVDAGNLSATNYDFFPLHLYKDSTHKLKWEIYSDGKIYVTIVDTATSYPWNATYVAATHKYLRIREALGTTYWDYSADGITWTNAYSVANPFAVTAFNAEIDMLGGGASTTTAKVDDFNILPSATATGFMTTGKYWG